MNRVYRMSRQELEGLVKLASEQVPRGVYALEKDEYAELRCDRCESMTQLKRLKRAFSRQGFKVYANG